MALAVPVVSVSWRKLKISQFLTFNVANFCSLFGRGRKMNNLLKFQLKVMELSESSAERKFFHRTLSGLPLAVDEWFSAEGISHFNLGESGRFPWH